MNHSPTILWLRLPSRLLAACWVVFATAGMACAQDLGSFSLTCLEIPDYGHGAGLAVVLRTPGGKTFLYDTGSGYPGKGDQAWSGDYNAGRDAVLPYLKTQGIDRIDGVLISHAHYDHFGGLLWLADHAEIPRLIDSGYVFPDKPDGELAAYDRLRERFQKRPGAYLAAHAGDRLDLDDRIAVEVLAPPRTFFQANPKRAMKNDTPVHYLPNANSLGIRIVHGTVVFLLPGDIQTIDQDELLLPNVPAEKLRCRVLVAPAHGIDASTAFARATHPEVTIASASGRYARWSQTPKVYGAEGSRVFVTGNHGRVTVTSDGQSITVLAERPEGKPIESTKPSSDSR
jgi:competence protein ComEC